MPQFILDYLHVHDRVALPACIFPVPPRILECRAREAVGYGTTHSQTPGPRDSHLPESLQFRIKFPLLPLKVLEGNNNSSFCKAAAVRRAATPLRGPCCHGARTILNSAFCGRRHFIKTTAPQPDQSKIAPPPCAQHFQRLIPPLRAPRSPSFSRPT